MKKRSHRFVLFWERTRRVNKWRFIFPVGLLVGLFLFGMSQFFRADEQEFLYFLSEFVVALALGIFLIGRLIWFYNERKFVRTLRKLSSPISY